jgi:hypothetical protein
MALLETKIELPPPPAPIRRGPSGAKAGEPEGKLAAARAVTSRLAGQLASAPSFRTLPEATRKRMLGELGTISSQLASEAAPRATGLGTPLDLRRRYPGDGQGAVTGAADGSTPAAPAGDGAQAGGADSGQTPDLTAKQQPATQTIGRRAGTLLDEIDFPDFVAGLIHNTFDAIVDASIRQMDAFADLVSAVAKTAEDFERDNVTDNHARDWLVQKYPKDLALDLSGPSPTVVPKTQPGSEADGDMSSPNWLADFDAEGQELTPELVESQLVPAARKRVARDRQQLLATMVLLGMNRVVVRDGTISARLQFRAMASDKSKVDFAVSDDPSGGGDWGSRASGAYPTPITKVSTIGVNVQTDSSLNASLFGEVKINFASETLPLDRFVDDARRTLLERRARPLPPAAPAPTPQTPAAAPAAAPAPAQGVAPAVPAPTPATPPAATR